jgi:alginate O-acetyltransferase complex protein AlgI
MLFNSLHFILFFVIIFILYWCIPNKKYNLQNLLLLIASFYFYSCWDWRFLFLLIFSTLLDYFTGIKISNALNHKHRKFWFLLSIFINLGFLGVFKYYNFFLDSFIQLLSSIHLNIGIPKLSIILPIGISFYTFHGLSYIIDIYNRRLQPERNMINYSLFVCFFPLLVAGPIERATHLLPQIKNQRTFSYSKSVDGLRQILWGFFKKIVIADGCATYADIIFAHYSSYNGVILFLGAVLFAIQIYGDFSGYSDIALGSARILGFELLNNFRYPYFSRDIAEFWRRWHISLSTWFRDYVYIPLGGSRGSTLIRIRNTFFIFLLSGLWHGANWTFVVWGCLHALFFIPLLLLNTNRSNIEIVAHGRFSPSIKELFQIFVTFVMVTLSWVFFRIDSFNKGLDYLYHIFSEIFIFRNYIDAFNFFYWEIGALIPLLLLFFFCIEWLGRSEEHPLSKILNKTNFVVRYFFYVLLLFAIAYSSGNEQQFIYFQF